VSVLPEDELRALLSDLESDRVERTVSTNKKDKFRRAICAFANDFAGHEQPGYLLIGVDDQGRPSGLEVTDELLVVKVLPSDMPPVRYDGRIHIRVGPRRAIANEQEERVLTERRVSAAKTFDLTPCKEATLNDLALELFASGYRPRTIAPEVIAANQRPIEQQLAALRFFDPHQNCPTHAGILLFGNDPRFWLPGAYVQFLRIDGVNLADTVIDAYEIGGDLSSILRHLDILTNTQIQRRPVPVPGSVLREQMARTYPSTALREFLLNAVMHRNYQSNGPIRYYWYNDRVEIQSPGGLYGEAKADNFPDRNDYRNPVLAEALKVLGYVEKYGRGVVRAQTELQENGNPKADFQFDSGFVQVTVRAVS